MTFGANLLLAVLWAALIGPFTPANLLAGFLVGYAILWTCTGGGARTPYARRVHGVILLTGFTVFALVLANLRVAWYTVSTLGRLKPAILRVPLEPGMTDGEITLLSNLITLTPGTLTLDVEPGGGAIFVHFMHVDDVEASIADVKQGFERRILEATR